jgi:hypothetical protein
MASANCCGAKAKRTEIYACVGEHATAGNAPSSLFPDGISLLDAAGETTECASLISTATAFDDLLFSNEERYAIHLWAKNVRPDLGLERRLVASDRKR